MFAPHTSTNPFYRHGSLPHHFTRVYSFPLHHESIRVYISPRELCKTIDTIMSVEITRLSVENTRGTIYCRPCPCPPATPDASEVRYRPLKVGRGWDMFIPYPQSLGNAAEALFLTGLL